jgi:hypothetical protein
MMETPAAPSARRRRVRYYADDRVTAMEMEPNHVMRPVRVRLTHSLVRSLDLHHDLEIYAPPRVDAVPVRRASINPAVCVSDSPIPIVAELPKHSPRCRHT